MNSIYKKYIVIGAGPGGLQMGYFLKSNKMDYVILEKGQSSGAFFKKFPIHRKLISINKKNNFFQEDEFNMRHDWNSLLSHDKNLRLTKYSDELFPHADVLYKYLNDFGTQHKLNIKFSSEVEQVKKNNELFEVKLTDGQIYTCSVLLMGTGAVSEVSPSEIEGIEHTTPYSKQSLNLEHYKNKRIAVLGGGNSAFETADYLSSVAAFVHVLIKHPVKMAWETHFVGDLRAVNNNIFDLYQLKSLHAVLRPKVKKIEKLPNGTLRTNHTYDYPDSNPPGSLELTREYDEIINCTGFNWINLKMFDDSIKPEAKQNSKYPLLNETWESVNVPHLYFIGGSMQAIDRTSASGFIHGFRYNIKSLANILLHKFENRDLENIKFSNFDEKVFFKNLYERFTLSAALFQLYGFLGDKIEFSDDRKSYTVSQELPVGYISKTKDKNKHTLMLTLEFGFKHFDKSSLTFLGPSDPNDTNCAAFLHPVIRHFYKDKISEFHFGDSLLGRWDSPHESGGAVMSYHSKLIDWLNEKLELNITNLNPNAANPYREWSQEEIDQYKKEKLELMSNSKKTCR